MPSAQRLIITLAAALTLPACTVGPDHEPPELPQYEAFRFNTADTLDTADTAWWTRFDDPALDALIEEALANNIDVRIATERVERFATTIGLTRSAAFPQVDADAGLGRAQNSREIAPGSNGGPRVSDFFEANLNVGWELDVFGRVRRATNAAVADTLTQEHIRRGVILSLVTSVATSYVGLRSLDLQLEIAQQKLQTRRDTVGLFELRYDRGVISRLELAQIQSELERTAATIPAIERDIALLENALSVLLGRPPGPIARGKPLDRLTPPPVPAGLPSDLLLRRPDLLAAEQALIAANERVGVAVAEFYPRFSLTASLGVASDELENLFSLSAGTYSIAGGALAPLFTAGFLENQLEGAKAAEREALETYRAAVLQAFRESEDALVTRTTTIDEAAAQARQTQALAVYAALAEKRYDNGFVDYLEVLDAERDLFDAELQAARLRASELSAVIGIYKAFGGGWVNIADEFTEAPDADSDNPNGLREDDEDEDDDENRVATTTASTQTSGSR